MGEGEGDSTERPGVLFASVDEEPTVKQLSGTGRVPVGLGSKKWRIWVGNKTISDGVLYQ